MVLRSESRANESEDPWRHAVIRSTVQLHPRAESWTGRRTRRPFLAVLLISGLALVSVGLWLGMRRSPEVLLRTAYREQRTFELRILGADYGPLRQERSDHLLSRLDRPLSLLLAEAWIAEKLKEKPSDHALLKLKARADLLNWSYQDAINALKFAGEDDPRSSEIRLDLATAYFERAEANDQPFDYGQAVELLGVVLQEDPTNRVALFNRGFVFEKMLLYRQAIRDWDAYLGLDPKSGWADEVRQERENVQSKVSRRGRTGDEPRISPSEYLASAPGAQPSIPTGGLEFDDQIFLDSAFLDWLPDAFPVTGDPGTKFRVESLSALRSLATRLKTIHHDPMLGDLLSGSAVPRFATAIHKLSEALRDERLGRPEAAAEAARQATDLFRRQKNSAGWLRSALEITYADHLLLKSTECHRIAETLRSAASQRSYQWIRIQTMLEGAACVDTLGDPGAATHLANESIDVAKNSNYGSLHLRAIVTEEWLLSDAGDNSGAWRVAHAGLERYWEGMFPPMCGYSIYYQAGYIAEALHQWHLFYALAEEATDSIEGTEDFELEAIARRRLFMAATRSGHSEAARSELRHSIELIEKAPRSALTEETMTENASEAALLEARSDLPQARKLLEQIRLSDSGFRNRTVALSYFEAAAEVALLEGDIEIAEREGLAAVAIAERIAGTLESAQQKIGWVEQTRNAYLGLTRALLARNQAEEALAVWERYRSIPFLRTLPVPVLKVADGAYEGLETASGGSVPKLDVSGQPKDELTLSYVHFEDGMQVWTVDRKGARGKWIKISFNELQSVASRFSMECADPFSSTQALERDARQLYSWLIAPFEDDVLHASALIIEPDISFESVPFAALIGSDGKYLAESHSIVVSVDGMSAITKTRSATVTTSSAAFVVGVPSTSEPHLEQLPDAESEAVMVAGQFETKELAVGAEATKVLVMTSLPRAEVFHFAGHAAVRNGETCLLLGGGGKLSERSASATLCADDVSHSNLSRCRIAVLSACSTGRQDDATPLNRHGMASALVYAGVPRVIASEWEVDSVVTRNLMMHFYENLLKGMNSGEALRDAGFEIRRNPTTSHPYFWAAFQTFGKP